MTAQQSAIEAPAKPNRTILQQELLRIWEVDKKTVVFITHRSMKRSRWQTGSWS